MAYVSEENMAYIFEVEEEDELAAIISWFPALLRLRPLRWKRYVHPKRLLSPNCTAIKHRRQNYS
jgi:hypothetical protein